MKPPPKRKILSKKLRFEIFARDRFTCRYCGRQSDQVILHVDHVTPVCQGGTNDPENLVTACMDCNLGKSGKTPTQAAPTEEDRLRLSQEMMEQKAAFAAIQEAVEARRKLEQELVNFWCDLTERDSVDSGTIAVVMSYIEKYGVTTVLGWITKAVNRLGSYAEDRKIGRYISGIRRKIEEGGQDA